MSALKNHHNSCGFFEENLGASLVLGTIITLLTIFNGDSHQVWEFVSTQGLVVNCCSASLILFCLSATPLATDSLRLGTLLNKLLSKGGIVPAFREFSVCLRFLSLWEDMVIYLFT